MWTPAGATPGKSCFKQTFGIIKSNYCKFSHLNHTCAALFVTSISFQSFNFYFSGWRSLPRPWRKSVTWSDPRLFDRGDNTNSQQILTCRGEINQISKVLLLVSVRPLGVLSPDRRGQCGCGRASREPTGWAAWGRGSAKWRRWCVQSAGCRRAAAAGTWVGARPWWGRWAWGWTSPPTGCPCWPRSLSSRSLPLRRCSPSRCYDCESEFTQGKKDDNERRRQVSQF